MPREHTLTTHCLPSAHAPRVRGGAAMASAAIDVEGLARESWDLCATCDKAALHGVDLRPCSLAQRPTIASPRKLWAQEDIQHA